MRTSSWESDESNAAVHARLSRSRMVLQTPAVRHHLLGQTEPLAARLQSRDLLLGQASSNTLMNSPDSSPLGVRPPRPLGRTTSLPALPMAKAALTTSSGRHAKKAFKPPWMELLARDDVPQPVSEEPHVPTLSEVLRQLEEQREAAMASPLPLLHNTVSSKSSRRRLRIPQPAPIIQASHTRAADTLIEETVTQKPIVSSQAGLGGRSVGRRGGAIRRAQDAADNEPQSSHEGHWLAMTTERARQLALVRLRGRGSYL